MKKIKPMRSIPILFICLMLAGTCKCQYTKYLIKFRHKGNNPFSISQPSSYLSQRAIDRRTKYSISIDSSDLPVTPAFIDSVRLSGDVTILNVSKWLNQISIETSDAAALIKINTFPFVLNTNPIAAKNNFPSSNKFLENSHQDILISGLAAKQQNADYFDYGYSGGQVRLHQGQFLHNHGFRGEGMQMAILDAGFYNYNILPTFDSIRNNHQILGTWDFVNREPSVSEDNAHGMNCFSTIGANMPGIFVGTAPKTSFYLFRTEDVNSEYPIEEHNLAAGAERADSLGVDICSISLGYSTFSDPVFDYTYADMNGITTISARATEIAASKGIIMVAAAGNEGSGSWHYIITPADTKSALTVGAVDTLGQVASFSSYGPTSDRRIKPSVAAVGRNAVVADPGTGMPYYSNGTSFACPNMAGLTTCLWQAFPEAGNLDIIQTLEQSATKATSPDNRMGYGIPDMKKAFVLLQKKYFTKEMNVNECNVSIAFHLKTDASMHIEIERKFSDQLNYITLTQLTNTDNFGMHSFYYEDNQINATSSTINYRLKVIIGSDTSFYITTDTVNFSSPCIITPIEENNISINPNPVIDYLNINITRINSSKIDLLLYNAGGQKIFTTSYTQDSGAFTKSIPMAGYSKGIYFLTVYIDNKKERIIKIIK